MRPPKADCGLPTMASPLLPSVAHVRPPVKLGPEVGQCRRRRPSCSDFDQCRAMSANLGAISTYVAATSGNVALIRPIPGPCRPVSSKFGLFRATIWAHCPQMLAMCCQICSDLALGSCRTSISTGQIRIARFRSRLWSIKVRDGCAPRREDADTIPREIPHPLPPRNSGGSSNSPSAQTQEERSAGAVHDLANEAGLVVALRRCVERPVELSRRIHTKLMSVESGVRFELLSRLSRRSGGARPSVAVCRTRSMRRSCCIY